MSLGSFSLGSATLATASPSGSTSTEGLAVIIGGISLGDTVRLKQNTLRIQDALGQRKTVTMVLLNRANDWRPAIGERIAIYWDGDLRYAGTVEEIDVDVIDSPEPCAVIKITGVDFNQIADRQLVVESFQTAGQTAGDIVLFLLDNYLTDDEVTEGLIEAGPEVVRAAWNYARVSDALNELAERTGYVWYIDANRRLNFHDRTSVSAGFDLSDLSSPFRNFKVNNNRGAYRNTQYLRGGQASTDSRTERFEANGTNKTVTLTFPAGIVTSVTVNSVAKTLGYRSTDEDKDFYWSRDDNQVNQDDAATPVAAVDFIDVTYQGLFPVVAVSALDDEIAERAAIEGGSGIYESVVDDPLVDNLDLAVEKIDGMLTRFGEMTPDVRYETDSLVLVSGAVQSLTLTDEQMTGDLLITSCSATYLDAAGIWRTQINGTTGQFLGSWVEYFRKLLGNAGGLLIRENEQVNKVINMFDQVLFTDSVSLVTALDDGSGDPYTPALAGGPESDSNLDFGVGIGGVGDGEA